MVPNNDVPVVPPNKKMAKRATATIANDNAMKPDLARRTKSMKRNSGLPRSGGKQGVANKQKMAKAPAQSMDGTVADPKKRGMARPATKALLATGKKHNMKVANVRKPRKHAASGMAKHPTLGAVQRSVAKTMGY